MTGSERVAVVLGLVLVGAGGYYFGRESAKAEIRNAVAKVVSGAPGLAAGVRPTDNTPPLSKGWRVKVDTSPMDDSRTVVLSLDANETFLSWPSEENRATLIIRCKEHQTELYVVTGTSPNVEYGLSDEATVRLRIDSSPASSQTWGKSTDGEALFARSAISLARRLAGARRLTFQFTPYNSNPATSTFDLEGLAQELPKVAEACRWTLG